MSRQGGKMATEASGFPRFSFGSTVSDIFGVIGRNFLLLCGLALLLYGVPSALFTVYLMNSIMSLVTRIQPFQAVRKSF